jgi:DNA-binding NtrC family response regulator
MAGACWFLKQPHGIRYLEKAIGYYERTDYKQNAADGYNNLGINLGELRMLRGDFDEALTYLDRAVAIATAHGNKWYQGQARRTLGRCYLAMKRGADALAEVERRMISGALRKHNGNISRAARELGLTRRGLYLKLGRHEMSASA